MPRRRKKKRRYHTGVHISPKCAAGMKYRSGWEYSYMKFLDNDPDVISYTYESLKIPYLSNKRSGKMRNYIPDFIIQRASGSTIVEVKPTRFLTRAAIRKKILAGEQYAQAHGMAYEIVDEHVLKGLGLL